MFKSDKVSYKIIAAISMLLIAAGVVFSTYNISKSSFAFTDTTLGLIGEGLNILCLIFAGFYICYGSNKNSARYYRWFGYLLGLGQLLSVTVVAFIDDKSIFEVLTSVFMFAVLLMLVFSENLGKRKSLSLGIVVIALNLLQMVLFLVTPLPEGAGEFVLQTLIITISVKMVLFCLYFVCTVAKYLDKSERHKNDTLTQ